MMSLSYSYIRHLLASVLILSCFQAHSATLSELYENVPHPPSDIENALSWVKDGKIVHTEYVAITNALADERTKLTSLTGSEIPKGRGLATNNIEGSPQLQAAARGYADYLLLNQGKNEPKAVLSKRKRWLQVAYGEKQMDIAKEMTPCPSPCTDTSTLASNEPLLYKRKALLNSEISAWNVLFDDWKKKRRKNVMSAEAHITATEDSKTAISQEGQSLIANYKAAMLDEIDLLLSITKLCVLRAEAIVNGLDGSESDAITGATKKTAK